MAPGTGKFEGRLKMKFPSIKSVNLDCKLDELSRSPPPTLPGGYKAGEKVYFTGLSQTFDDGDRLVHGEQGEVMGPSKKTEGNLLIKFPNNKGNVPCTLAELSRSPPLPGGYKLGEKLYYIGFSQTFDDGNRVVYGEQGVVMGPKRGDASLLLIKFLNNKGNIACTLDQLSRSPPAK